LFQFSIHDLDSVSKRTVVGFYSLKQLRAFMSTKQSPFMDSQKYFETIFLQPPETNFLIFSFEKH